LREKPDSDCIRALGYSENSGFSIGLKDSAPATDPKRGGTRGPYPVFKERGHSINLVLDPGTGFTLYTLSVKQNSFLYSSELARLAGVSTDTLRHYERKGLLPRPPRSSNGYRHYSLETPDRVRLVQRALAVGFSLDELARILRERDKGKAPCREVRALAQEKLANLEKRIAELETLRSELQNILQDWDLRLAQTEPGERANLLNSLTTAKAAIEAGSEIFHSGLNGTKSRRRKLR